MVQKWILNAAITFIIRQIGKFGTNINWDKVKADLHPRVAAIVPGKWLDQEAIELCDELIDRCAYVLSQAGDIELVVRFAVAEQWDKALAALSSLLLKGWETATNAQRFAYAELQDLATLAA